MATHSSFLAWKIPWTEESSRMQSVGWEESDATFSLNFQAFLSFFFFFKDHKANSPMCERHSSDGLKPLHTRVVWNSAMYSAAVRYTL